MINSIENLKKLLVSPVDFVKLVKNQDSLRPAIILYLEVWLTFGLVALVCSSSSGEPLIDMSGIEVFLADAATLVLLILSPIFCAICLHLFVSLIGRVGTFRQTLRLSTYFMTGSLLFFCAILIMVTVFNYCYSSWPIFAIGVSVLVFAPIFGFIIWSKRMLIASYRGLSQATIEPTPFQKKERLAGIDCAEAPQILGKGAQMNETEQQSKTEREKLASSPFPIVLESPPRLLKDEKRLRSSAHVFVVLGLVSLAIQFLWFLHRPEYFVVPVSTLTLSAFLYLISHVLRGVYLKISIFEDHLKIEHFRDSETLAFESIIALSLLSKPHVKLVANTRDGKVHSFGFQPRGCCHQILDAVYAKRPDLVSREWVDAATKQILVSEFLLSEFMRKMWRSSGLAVVSLSVLAGSLFQFLYFKLRLIVSTPSSTVEGNSTTG